MSGPTQTVYVVEIRRRLNGDRWGAWILRPGRYDERAADAKHRKEDLKAREAQLMEIENVEFRVVPFDRRVV